MKQCRQAKDTPKLREASTRLDPVQTIRAMDGATFWQRDGMTGGSVNARPAGSPRRKPTVSESQAGHTFRITVPFQVRADELIRRALYRRRRGRALEPETAGVIRAEVQRLFEKHTNPTVATSQRKTSAQFWAHLPPGERYARYRVVVKDHLRTIQSCLDLL